MSERIDLAPAKDTALEIPTNLFYDGPAEFLCKKVVDSLRLVPQFAQLFGITDTFPEGYIDAYKRLDYPIRALPALRIYNNDYEKQFDSWFIEGDLLADLIWPASLRRNELQQYQDTVSTALLQQFRRPEFFEALSEAVPGLNELGKRFFTDKSLGFEWGDSVVPLTQMRLNFRIDLRIWDDYLERTNRTKDSPFEETLATLTRIVTTIQALRDNGEQDNSIAVDQRIEGD